MGAVGISMTERQQKRTKEDQKGLPGEKSVVLAYSSDSRITVHIKG
jgi:hypothetical protein